MGLEQFKTILKRVLLQGGYSQKQLAVALGTHPTLLSNKLSGIRKSHLNYFDIKQIIKTLAEWELIFTEQEVVQMLAELGFSPQFFNAEEWATPPLNRLRDKSDNTVVGLPLAFQQQTSEQNKPGTNRVAGKNEETDLSRDKPSRNNWLPQSPTSLIGREEVLSEVSGLLLQENVRLLTLIGPGGIGKTRIAQAVAGHLQFENFFKDGVFYIPLDNLTNADLVAKALANGLGLREKKDNISPLNQVIEFVASQEILLVLDNFEQLLKAAPDLDKLLEHAPNLKLLVTTRVTLDLYGEWTYTVPPLPLPDSPPAIELAPNPKTSPTPDGDERLKAALDNPAVALFVVRARAANLHFNLNEQNFEVVIKICRVLDGLPLAIELAASRTRFFDLNTLLELLQQSFLAVLKIKVAADRWRAERHLSLQACLDWSYNLLEPSERELFCRLGIFADGFNVATALSILPDGFTKEDLYLGLDSLLSKSLLQISEIPAAAKSGENLRRYRMLEPLREYGLEHLRILDTRPEQTATQPEEFPDQNIWRQYCHYWASWVKTEVEKLYGPEVHASYQRLQTEYTNILEALEWGLQHGARKEVLELASELAFYWIWGTRYNEGSGYLDRVFKLCRNPAPTDPQELSLLGKMLYGAGFIAVNQMEFEKAQEELQESFTIFRNLGDKNWLARVLSGLSFRATSQGEFLLGRNYLDKSLALSRETGNEQRVAAALNNLGVVSIHLRENEAALEYCRECLNLCHKQNNRGGQAMTLNLLGYLSTIGQNFPEALKNLEESREISLDLGNRESLNLTQNVLALCYYGQGDFEEAARHITGGLRIAFEIGDRFGVLYNLSVQPAIAIKLIGSAEEEVDKLAWAACLLGATSALSKRTSGFALPRFRDLFEESLRYVRARLSPAIFETEWKRGEKLNLEEAVALVWKFMPPKNQPD